MSRPDHCCLSAGRRRRARRACKGRTRRGERRTRRLDLHSTDERQRTPADAIGRHTQAERRKAKKAKKVEDDEKASGTKVARRRKNAS
jgi:hypothetical protein